MEFVYGTDFSFWTLELFVCLFVSLCLWRHHRHSLCLAELLSWNIDHLSALLAGVCLNWLAATEPQKWLKSLNEAKEEEKKEPAHRVHKRQSPAPSSSPYKSQCLIPLVYHLLLHSPLSVFLFFYPAFFFFWNKWLNLTGHFQEGVPEQSNANTILLDYVVHGWDSKFKAALSTGVMWKILQIWVTVNRAEFSPLHRLYDFFLQRGVFLLATRPNESYLFSLTVMNFKI